MKKYSVFHIPVLSFYSKALYRDVCFNWRGTGLAYLLLLLTVCWIPVMAKLHVSFSTYCRNEAPKFISQFPEITFSNGIATVAAPQPYSIKDPKTQKALIVFDTTGKIDSLKDTEAVVLIKQNEAIYRKSDVETRSFDFKSLNRFTVNQEKITGWLEIVRRYMAITFYPFAVAGSYVFRIVQLLIYAAVGMVFASLCRSKRSYDSLLRLAAVAGTPGIIVNTILHVAGVQLPFAGLWFFLAAMAYLFVGVRECAKDDIQTEDQCE